MEEYGRLEFISSMENLNRGFQWAKETALSYVHNGEDPVGPWYEAALPARDAFCMRDTAHHAAGASALGLAAHTKNMLRRFAESISESREWCGYWEITKDNLPCPDDYDSDTDFWYNFPGSFDVIVACFQEYKRTGDEDYLTDPVFNRYYELTCTKLVEHWDKDGDGLPEHYPAYGRRGIASYDECAPDVLLGGDMLACQWAAYGCYVQILQRQGREEETEKFARKQKRLRQEYLSKWFDSGRNRFYGAIRSDGSFEPNDCREGNFLPAYYGILDGEKEQRAAYDQIKANPPRNVEGMSYWPSILCRCGDDTGALEALLALANPELKRREYPEVSFAFVGSLVEDVMGVRVLENELLTRSALPEDENARLRHLPLLGGEIDVEHRGRKQTVLTNRTGKTLIWKAAFAGSSERLFLDEAEYPVRYAADAAGNPFTFLMVKLLKGETKSVRCI